MGRPPRSPSPTRADEVAVARSITRQVLSDHAEFSPESAKENAILSKLRTWHESGMIDTELWKQRSRSVVDASLKRAGLCPDEAGPAEPPPKRLKAADTSRASKASVKSVSGSESSDAEQDHDFTPMRSGARDKADSLSLREDLVRAKRLADAQTKFGNHAGTKVVVVDAEHKKQVRFVKNSYMDTLGKERRQWTFDDKASLWGCQVCTCGNGRSFNPIGEDKFTNKIKHNGTATHTNALLSKKWRPALQEGDTPIHWPTGIKLTTDKEYIEWAMAQSLEGTSCVHLPLAPVITSFSVGSSARPTSSSAPSNGISEGTSEGDRRAVSGQLLAQSSPTTPTRRAEEVLDPTAHP